MTGQLRSVGTTEPVARVGVLLQTVGDGRGVVLPMAVVVEEHLS
jgi:hypothetical protein